MKLGTSLYLRPASISLGVMVLGMPLSAYGIGTVVNFTIANNGAAGPPTNANIVYNGQGAVFDPSGTLWNGAGPGFNANVNGNNTTSSGAATPVTFSLSANLTFNGGLGFDGPDGLGGNTHQGTPFFLLGHCVLTNGANPGIGDATNPRGQWTLNNVPASTYDVYLYGSNYDADRGAVFSVSSGTPDSGTFGTVNAGQAANNSFTQGVNFVVFHNVTPDANGTITGTWTPNPASTLQGEGNFNALQLVAPGTIVVEPEWGVNSAGDWNVASNWIGGIPNGVGAVAKLLTKSTSNHTIFTDAPVTLGTLRMENGATYVVAGNGSLNMQVATGAGSINVSGGAQKINLPLNFASSTNINVAGGASLSISDPTTIKANQTVNKLGGLLKFQSSLSIETGGALILGPGGNGLFGAPNLAGTAKVDVGGNSAVVHYAGLSSPLNQIKALITTGYAGGSWNGNGITSSAAQANSTSAHKTALGYGEATATAVTGNLNGEPIDSTSVLIRHVYSGDANLDGKVDTLDFNSLAGNFGGTGKVWTQADFNYDGTVDTLDFNFLASNFGQQISEGSGAGAGALVPEPAGLLMFAGLAAPGLLRRRRNAR
jgi:hypothetical protein